MSVTVLFGSYVTLSAKMWGRISQKWIILWCWLDMSLSATRASCELTKIVNRYFKPSLTGEHTLYSDKFRLVQATARRTNDVRVTNLSEATLTRHWKKSNSTGWKFVHSGVPFTLTVRKFRPPVPFKVQCEQGNILNRLAWTKCPVKFFSRRNLVRGRVNATWLLSLKRLKSDKWYILMSKDKQR